MRNILITICGRGGSVGIPKKNIRLLNGKPLIAYTIQFAQQLRQIYNAEIALSTDCSEIKNVAKEYGLETEYIRPLELASNHSGKIDVITHITEYVESKLNVKFDYIVDLDITSPIRTAEDIKNAFNKLIENPEAINIFSVNAANRNPYFNMVEELENGYVKLVKSTSGIIRRQDAPNVYDMNASFYIYKKSFFEDKYTSAITKKSLIYEMDHICFDIDHEIDFQIMEFLLTNKLIQL